MILLIIAAAIGYVAGLSSTDNSQEASSLEEEAAVEETAVLENEDRFFVGNIADVLPNGMIVELEGVQKNPKDSNVRKTALIGPETRVIRFDEKTDEEVQADIKRFEEFKKSGVAPNSEPPGRFKEVSIGLNDLKVGDTVVVDAGKDFKQLSEFTALSITLQNR